LGSNGEPLSGGSTAQLDQWRYDAFSMKLKCFKAQPADAADYPDYWKVVRTAQVSEWRGAPVLAQPGVDEVTTVMRGEGIARGTRTIDAETGAKRRQ
jgi:hypothetical protein